MLEMGQVYVVRHKVLSEGLSVRRVAAELGLSRNTVRKYVQAEEPLPVRREREARPRPVLDAVRQRMDEILEDAKARSTRKQRPTGTAVHRMLLAAGFVVGITTVRAYLALKRREAQEVFIPLDYPPGDLAEVDFFEVSVDITGERRQMWMFLLRWMYAGRDFAWLYERQDQVSFLDGHVRAFAHFGCVPQRVAYDNLKPAVRKVLVGSERLLQVRFAALCTHHGFDPCFARPGEGHDKGGVEARGRGVRLRHMWPVPSGETMDAVREALVAKLDEQAAAEGRRGELETALQRFEAERREALPLPPRPFDPRAVVLVEASSRSLVRIELADYSVPTTWARRSVTAFVGPETVELACAGASEQVTHRRLRRGRSVVYRHYLRELRRKPQAVRQCAGPLLAELGEPFATAWRLLVDERGPLGAARAFAEILGVIVDRDESTVAKALRGALARGEVSLAGLAPLAPPAPMLVLPAALAAVEVEQARAADFDQLLGGGGAA